MLDNFRTLLFVGLFLTYDIDVCRTISHFIFRSISYLTWFSRKGFRFAETAHENIIKRYLYYDEFQDF